MSVALKLLLMYFIISPMQGESLERIEELFSKPWLQRINLPYYLRYIQCMRNAQEIHSEPVGVICPSHYQLTTPILCTDYL